MNVHLCDIKKADFSKTKHKYYEEGGKAKLLVFELIKSNKHKIQLY